MTSHILAVLPTILLAAATTAQADSLTFKNVGEEAMTLEFHRRGEKEEPRIPLPLKPGETRNLKPQEETFYGLVITDHQGREHRVGYRRMRGLAVKHPGAVIEVRPRGKLVTVEKEMVVMIPVVREVIDENGDAKQITELRAETRVFIAKERQVTGFDIVLTKDGADDLPLEFRQFVKPPKAEP